MAHSWSVENTQHYDPYEEESQMAEMFHILDEEPDATPEWGDQYVNAEILFLRGDRMTRY